MRLSLLFLTFAALVACAAPADRQPETAPKAFRPAVTLPWTMWGKIIPLCSAEHGEEAAISRCANEA